MSLIRNKTRRETWADEELRKPPTLARALLPTFGAIGGFVWVLIQGARYERLSWGGTVAAFVLGIVAIEQWRRLRDGGDADVLSDRVLCPTCEAPLSLDEAQVTVDTFLCPSCRETFTVTD